jgi:hypothetical protein
MRLFWSGFLVVGLFLTGLSVYERRQLRQDRSTTGVESATAPVTVSMREDGTDWPDPTSTPRP